MSANINTVTDIFENYTKKLLVMKHKFSGGKMPEIAQDIVLEQVIPLFCLLHAHLTSLELV